MPLWNSLWKCLKAFFFSLQWEANRIFSENIYWPFSILDFHDARIKFIENNFRIRFPCCSLENKMPLFCFPSAVFYFPVPRRQVLQGSDFKMPGPAAFQSCFSISVVTVFPRATLLRLFLQLIKSLHLQFMPFWFCLHHRKQVDSSVSGIALLLDHSISCFSPWMSLYWALFDSSLLRAVRACIIQKLKRDFSGRFWCIYTFMNWVFRS